jgi:HEAT repeat protein
MHRRRDRTQDTAWSTGSVTVNGHCGRQEALCKTKLDKSLGLAQIGRPLVDRLAKALNDSDPRVRRGAALALGQIRPVPAGISEKLTVGLADPDREVKAAFLTAIGNLGPRARESVPAVRALLQDSSAEVRGKAPDA